MTSRIFARYLFPRITTRLKSMRGWLGRRFSQTSVSHLRNIRSNCYEKIAAAAAVQYVALFLLMFAVYSARGLFAPELMSARFFGLPTVDIDGTLYYRVYLSRNLAIVVAGFIFLDSPAMAAAGCPDHRDDGLARVRRNGFVRCAWRGNPLCGTRFDVRGHKPCLGSPVAPRAYRQQLMVSWSSMPRSLFGVKLKKPAAVAGAFADHAEKPYGRIGAGPIPAPLGRDIDSCDRHNSRDRRLGPPTNWRFPSALELIFHVRPVDGIRQTRNDRIIGADRQSNLRSRWLVLTQIAQTSEPR
jgi:hypothetical protein